MATSGSRGNPADEVDVKNKSLQVTPQKIRELLNEGIALEDSGRNSVEPETEQVAPNGFSQVPCEAVSKAAFFSRVESYSCLKWAGKPHVLSPLRCARYGWVNVECDMLKCSSCQAFLCVSLQPSRDIHKYEERLLELTKALQTQHEKFCFWPDFPCPDRFWAVPVTEPAVMFGAFTQRFQSCCLLELQLPAMKPEHLKTMSLTEDAIGVLLQLLEDKLKREGSSSTALTPLPLSVQVAACIVALCGWEASPALNSLHLPMLTCSTCLRKIGLWSFHQIEGVTGDGDCALESPGPGQDGRGDRPTPGSPTPCRMKLRSQDAQRPHGPELPQAETSPSSAAARSRLDSPSPSEELHGTPPRGKRPLTRRRGQGEAVGGDVPSSPQRKAKQARLSSAGCLESPMLRGLFDPESQHRDWCPWVSTNEQDAHTGIEPVEHRSHGPDQERPLEGWRAALELFLSMKKSASPTGDSPSQGLHDKSKRVFKIFHQWQASSPQ